MGTRYFVDIKCAECGRVETNWYYAPTSDLGLDFTCQCGHKTDLEAYTGITHADASNLSEMRELMQNIAADRESSDQSDEEPTP